MQHSERAEAPRQGTSAARPAATKKLSLDSVSRAGTAERERARALPAGHAVNMDVVLVSRVNSAAERETAMAELSTAATTAVAS